MARPDLWSLLCKWEIVSRGRKVWLTVLSLHSSPITHWESMDLFDWGDTGERNDCSASICSAALCCSLCVCVHILLLCHVAVYLKVHPIWRHLLLTNLLLCFTVMMDSFEAVDRWAQPLAVQRTNPHLTPPAQPGASSHESCFLWPSSVLSMFCSTTGHMSEGGELGKN